jgi:predicted GNAT family N-acyltransferase
MNRSPIPIESDPSGLSSLPVIRAAESHEDRERIFRFRYQVYVEEMHRLQKYADHERRRIEEPFDATGHLLIAVSDGEVVGTLRTNLSSRADLGYYVQLFKLPSVGDAWPDRVSLTTKLMVAPSHRSGRLAVRLAREMYAFGEANGVEYDIIDCNAHLQDFFSRLGYQPYMGTAIHPEYGEVLPMRLALRDVAYLRSIRSPLAPPRPSPGWQQPASTRPDPTFLSANTTENRPRQTSMKHTPETTAPNAAPGAPGSLIQWLDLRIADILREVEASEFWKAVTSPEADPRLAREAMKEVYLEIFSYQAHAIEGAINAIAKMPRSMPVRMIKAMLRHQAEEFDHGEMALRDYVRLGGDEAYARHHHSISPASYATASIWRTIGLLDEPFSYLGALYPFEGLTPIVSARVKAALLLRGFPTEALEFVEFHSTEDPKHTELIRHLIEETAQRYPDAEQSIRDGLERFLAIYPLPVWDTAYRRACHNLSAAHAA